MNADGSNATPLTTPQCGDAQPAGSPDGAKIAFDRAEYDDYGQLVNRIYVMNAGGSSPVSVTTGFNPAWSPDGRKLAFASNQDQDGSWGIFVMNADGLAAAPRLTSSTYCDDQPAWSPDGATIAFTRVECCDDYYQIVNHIYLMNADGPSAEMRLMSDDNNDQSDPAWSPDGRKIAFTYFGSGLAIVNGDGTRLVDFGVLGFNPVWRPQGSQGATLARVGSARAPASAAARARARQTLPSLRRHTPLRFPATPRR